jgi:hypothetical protein
MHASRKVRNVSMALKLSQKQHRAYMDQSQHSKAARKWAMNDVPKIKDFTNFSIEDDPAFERCLPAQRGNHLFEIFMAGVAVGSPARADPNSAGYAALQAL